MKLMITWLYDYDKPFWLGQTWAVQPLHQVSSATRQDCAVRLFDDLVGMVGWVRE